MSATCANGCQVRPLRDTSIITPRKTRSHYPLSRQWHLPKRDHLLSLPVHLMSFKPPTWTNPRSPKRFEPAKESAGTSIQSVCSQAPSASSGLATTPTWFQVGSPLKAGATVADVGCGHGASTIVMAQAY